MSASERMAQEERRQAREEWKRAGGSTRRPLKSFSTADEKKARRLEHAARIADAVDALKTPSGFAEWRESLERNPDVSALNAALIAFQCPGEIAGTAAFWKRNGYAIEKGATAAGWITGPMFYPRAIFTAAQAGADDLARMAEDAPSAEHDPAAFSDLCGRLDSGDSGKDAANAIAEYLGLREAA